jgi:hypothetical protein
MRFAKYSTLTCFLALASFVAILGCGSSVEPPKKTLDPSGEKKIVAEKGHDHSHWWCKEHGVPEEVCSICSTKMAAKFKKDGDWCDKHERADSQCFQCHPEKFAKFAAQYEAKYGEQPPKPTE